MAECCDLIMPAWHVQQCLLRRAEVLFLSCLDCYAANPRWELWSDYRLYTFRANAACISQLAYSTLRISIS